MKTTQIFFILLNNLTHIKPRRITHRRRLYGALLLLSACLIGCSQNRAPSSNTNQQTSGVTQNIEQTNNNWSSPIEIDNKIINSPTAPILHPQLSITGAGDAFITWQAPNTSAMELTIPPQVKWRKAGEATWIDNTPEIALSNDSNITAIKVHTHSVTGIAYATWQTLASEVTDHDQSYISRYDPINGWGPSINMGNSLSQPHILFDDVGDATLLWLTHNENGTLELHSKRYTASQGLSVMHNLVRGQTDTPSYFSISGFTGMTDDQGNSQIFWWESQASPDTSITTQDNQLWHSEFSLTSGWQTPNPILAGKLELSTAVQESHYIAMPDSNDAVLVIARRLSAPASTSSIHAMHFQNGTWNLPERIDHEGVGEAAGIDISSNHRGEIAVVWSQLVNVPQTKQEIYARRYTPEQGWHMPQLISTTPVAPISNPPTNIDSRPSMAPQVAINPQGELIVAWLDVTQPTREIFVNQFNPATGWDEPSMAVNTELTAETLSSYALAIDQNNKLTLIWQAMIRDNQNTSYQTLVSDHQASPTTTDPQQIHPTTLTFAENTRISRSPVTTSDNWSAPETIWEIGDFDNKTSYLTVPSFISGPNQTLYLSLRMGLAFDNTVLSFHDINNFLFTNTTDSGWQNELPSNNPNNLNSTALQLISDSSENISVKAWLKNKVLYINHQTSNNSLWSTPQQIAIGAAQFWLRNNNQGQTAIVWQTIDDTQSLHASYITKAANERLTITPPTALKVFNGRPFSQLVMDSQGRIAIAWLVMQDNIITPSLQMSRLLASGWESPSTMITMDQMDDRFALLSPTIDDTLLVIVLNKAERHLYASRFDPQTGWSLWENIDQNLGKIDVVMGQPHLANNDMGEVMVLWVEETLKAAHEFSHQIASTRYQATADENGRYWSQPVLLGDIHHPGYYATPQLVMAEDGSAAAVWPHHNNQHSSILANKYTPQNGWLKHPEVVALSGGFKNLMLSPANDLYVVWQTQSTDDNSNSTIQVSKSNISPTPPPEPEPPITEGNWYRPTVDTTWQWQLQGELNITYPVDIYNIDLFDTPPEMIAELHTQQHKVICYFSAGSFEPWRPDADRFQESDLGPPLEGYPEERWLDIRSENVLTILKDRLDLAKQKNCDGVEPDNVDVYLSSPSLGITADDQLAFNRRIANEAHKRELSVALKNGLTQIPQLIDYFDFSVNEQCHQFNECELLNPFIEAGKPVLNAEYQPRFTTEPGFSQLCETARAAQFRTIVLSVELDGSLRMSCDEMAINP